MKKLLAFAFVMTAATGALAQPAPAPTFAPLGPNSALLSVNAEGQSRRTPDIAVFSAGVVTQAPTAGEALADNSGRMDRVVAALKREGIADRDIQTSSISLQPRYSDPRPPQPVRTGGPVPEPEAPRIIGYEARNTVQVRVRDLDRMGRVIDRLIAEGANQVNGPSFTLDEPDAALDEARTEAVSKARSRAELYARAAGMRVTRILSISESGGASPLRENFAMARAAPAAAPTPVAPGELTLGITLSVQFELTR